MERFLCFTPKPKTMKVRIIALLLIAAISTAFIIPQQESEIKWLDFNKGYALAKKKNKIMLVDVYTEWCGWCKRMDRDAYAKGNIIQAVNEDFVAVKFNPEVQGVVYEYNGKKYNGEQLAAAISNNRINGYPTTIFLYPKTKQSEIVVGYKNAEQMEPVLTEMKKIFYGK